MVRPMCIEPIPIHVLNKYNMKNIAKYKPRPECYVRVEVLDGFIASQYLDKLPILSKLLMLQDYLDHDGDALSIAQQA